eukprot:4886604-Pyramimonas_sp.AAC.1
MAQECPKRASMSQDGFQYGPCYFKVGSLRQTPNRPQGSPKTDPSALRAPHGAFQDASTFQQPSEN